MCVSCFKKVKRNLDNPLSERTLLRVKPTDSGNIIFNSCWANVPKIKFYKGDSLYRDWGQESHNYHIKSYRKKENLIIYEIIPSYIKKSGDLGDKIESLKISVKDSLYVSINNDLFIDSLYSSLLPYYKQPCEECYEKELCDKWKKNGEW